MTTPVGGAGTGVGTPVGGGIGLPGGGVGLPRAGAGMTERTSTSFLLVLALLAMAQIAVLTVIRRLAGRRPELEDDGILGL